MARPEVAAKLAGADFAAPGEPAVWIAVDRVPGDGERLMVPVANEAPITRGVPVVGVTLASAESMVSPLHRTTARSIVFSSWRTFPGHRLLSSPDGAARCACSCAWQRTLGPYVSTCGALRRMSSMALSKPLARWPKRSVDSVSAASAALGERHVTSTARAFPPSASESRNVSLLSR